MRIIWVSVSTGSDLTGDGSQAKPYATIERGLQDFTSGSQLRLLDGIYTPTDSIIVSGKDGSIMAENPLAATISPQKTKTHQACLAILDAERFSILGINILQAADNDGNLIGLYAENISTFLAYTVNISDFAVPSGNAYGIFASGDGRVENCAVSNLACAGDSLHGIYTVGIDVIDCSVQTLSGAGDCTLKGIVRT